jgi:hypothetical protein
MTGAAMVYGYEIQRLSAARGCLQSSPDILDDPQAIASALRECAIALIDFDPIALDSETERWVATIKAVLDSSAQLEDPNMRGTIELWAQQATETEREAIVNAIRLLADWCDRAYFGDA